MGWVRPDQLPAELAKAVARLKAGRPVGADPVWRRLLPAARSGSPARRRRAASKQEAIYDLVQVVFPLPPKANEAALRAAIGEAEQVRTAAKDCPTLLKIGKEKAPQLSSEGKLPESRISPRNAHVVIDGSPIGQASQPIVQKNGVGVIMVCGKSTGRGDSGTREEIAESLLRQRLDTVARRYLRDLRRNAYVDVRV